MISGTRYRLTQNIAQQQRLAAEIARAQSDIVTQTRIRTPSDDPAAAARLAALTRTQSNEDVWAANSRAALAISDRVDTSLESLVDRVDRAKTLMLSAANATLSPADRKAIAAELRGLTDDVASRIGETDSRGQPLYAIGPALAYPVGPSLTIQAGATRVGIFEALPTADGPKDLIAILTAAADGIELPETEAREAATSLSLAEIDVAAGSVSDARAEQGVRAARLTAVRDHLADTRLTNAEERSGLADTDIEETVVRLQAKLTALQAAQALFARTTQKGLFDYI